MIISNTSLLLLLLAPSRLPFIIIGLSSRCVMNPLFLILFFVLCIRINCSDSEVFIRGDISSLDEYVSVQTTSASSASAINHSWHPNNQTASELRKQNNLVSTTRSPYSKFC
jgi:hypothetical protein